MFRFAKHLMKVMKSDAIDVSEVDGVRSLHLGSETIQSAMRVRNPNALELTYTRGMMCFLLFNTQVKNVLSIGLGGGSIAKYTHAYCPEIISTVIELNPKVIQVARSQFYLPENDDRLTVIEGDGLQYLTEHPESEEVLLIDAFDSHGIPSDFCSQDFFDLCASCLTLNGIFAINLWGSDKNFDIYLQRIEQSFKQKVLVLRTANPGNTVVFGFNKTPSNLTLTSLRERANTLEITHKIEFNHFVGRLIDDNPTQQNKLIFKNEKID
ncbi:MAG: polyamine aminopropyltransferase [Methylophilaceae bacterium]